MVIKPNAMSLAFADGIHHPCEYWGLFIVGVTSSIHIMGIPMPCTRHHHFHGFPFRSLEKGVGVRHVHGQWDG